LLPSDPAKYQAWSVMITPAVPRAITSVRLASPAAANAPAAARMILPGKGNAVASTRLDTNTTA